MSKAVRTYADYEHLYLLKTDGTQVQTGTKSGTYDNTGKHLNIAGIGHIDGNRTLEQIQSQTWTYSGSSYKQFNITSDMLNRDVYFHLLFSFWGWNRNTKYKLFFVFEEVTGEITIDKAIELGLLHPHILCYVNKEITPSDNFYVGDFTSPGVDWSSAKVYFKPLGKLKTIYAYVSTICQSGSQDYISLSYTDIRDINIEPFDVYKVLIDDDGIMKKHETGGGWLDVCNKSELTTDIFLEHGMSIAKFTECSEHRTYLKSSKPSVMVLTDSSRKLFLKENYKSHDELVSSNYLVNIGDKPIESIEVSGVCDGDNILKFAIDDTENLKVFKDGAWNNISVEELKNNYMTLDEINNLTLNDLSTITTSNQIRLVWYMKRNDSSKSIGVNSIKINYL